MRELTTFSNLIALVLLIAAIGCFYVGRLIVGLIIISIVYIAGYLSNKANKSGAK